MNLLVTFGLVLICCHVWAIETNDYSSLVDKATSFAKRNKVEKFLEDLKDVLRKGNSSNGIPVLDPIVVDQMPIKINENILKLDALFTDVDVRGLSEYKVNSGNFKIIGLQLSVNLSWPLIFGKTNYEIDGIIGEDFPIFGKGDVKMNPQNLDVNVDLFFTPSGKSLKVKSIKSSVSLKSFQFNITGLFNDKEMSELISAVVSDMVPQIFKDYPDFISNILNPLIEKPVNAYLSTKTMLDLIKMFV